MYMKKEKIVVFLMGMGSALIISAIAIIIYFKLFASVNGELKAFNIVNIDNPGKKINVLVVTKKIEKGEMITREKILLTGRNKNYISDNTIMAFESAIGKKAATILEKNVILSSAMLIDPKTEVMPDERISDYELQGGLVSGLVKEGDFIDIEYIKQDGSTYVVMAKKKINKKIDEKIIIQTTLLERQMINYALTEINSKGGKIKASIYINDSQPASLVTYNMSKTSITNNSSGPYYEEVTNQTSITSEKKDGEFVGGVR